jgi:Protein of unknown function, DUF547
MYKPFLFFIVLLPFAGAMAQSSSPAVRYSELILFAIRDKQPTDQLLQQVKIYDWKELQDELKTDNYKKAFWINIYNAYVQVLLAQRTGLTTVPVSFFNEKKIVVAGKTFSLSEIENTLLKKGKGALDSNDYRIHLVLNKGTVSSPFIVVFDSDNIETLLPETVYKYLKSSVHLDEDGFEAEVPMVFKRYRADFGGTKNIIEILRKNEVVFMNVKPELEYKKDDMTLKLNNFLIRDDIKKQ